MNRFFKNQKGLGTVEILIIVAVLVSIALFFKSHITTFVKHIGDKVFDTTVETSVTDELTGELKDD